MGTTVEEHYINRPDVFHQVVYIAGVSAQAATELLTTDVVAILHVVMHQEGV